MNSQREGAVAYDAGDVVKVRDEEVLSVVVVPTDRAADCLPDNTPDLGAVCCVPLALVRTPIGEGVLRWVELRDLTRVGPESDVLRDVVAPTIFGGVHHEAIDGDPT